MAERRGDLLYVWQVGNDEGWSIIAAGEVEAAGHTMLRALVTPDRAIAEGYFRMYADAHRQDTGRPVRLATFKLGTILEVDST